MAISPNQPLWHHLNSPPKGATVFGPWPEGGCLGPCGHPPSGTEQKGRGPGGHAGTPSQTQGTPGTCRASDGKRIRVLAGRQAMQHDPSTWSAPSPEGCDHGNLEEGRGKGGRGGMRGERVWIIAADAQASLSEWECWHAS